jgi:MFS family permease
MAALGTDTLNAPPSDRYKWVALSNTTLGVFMASLDSSIVLISLPAIFRGIRLDPLQPANVGYLLWMLMGYLVVTAVLVVTFGRLGDMYGRVRMYNAGFAVFSAASLALSLCPWFGSKGAIWLIAWRVVQGIGGALLMANSAAILTDAFPSTQRGFAIGVSVIAGMAGAFIGLIVGGVLADVDWRAVFWVLLIIWLQGIWLPLHGYSFERTPLWAGIYMLPLTGGFLLAGPLAGWLSDRYGARPFATGGMIIAAASFGFLTFLPADFAFGAFAALLLMNGIGMGLFAAPNMTGIMNSVPPENRGAASGMRATFQNSGMVLSVGVFFSLMIIGLAATLPQSMSSALQANGVAPAKAHQIAALPPVGSLFAAFLGYNPMQKLLGSASKAGVSAAQFRQITGKTFFPHLIANPFMHGLRIAFLASLIMCLVAAAASWLRGGRYVAADVPGRTDPGGPLGGPSDPNGHGESVPEPEERVPA